MGMMFLLQLEGSDATKKQHRLWLNENLSLELRNMKSVILFYKAGFSCVNEHRVWQLDLQREKHLVKHWGTDIKHMVRNGKEHRKT